MASVALSILSGSLVLATLGASVSSYAQPCTSAPDTLPGSVLGASAIAANEYEVLRNGKMIGQHTVSFESNQDRMTVTAETHMQVKILFFTAYRYHYKSQEFWCGKQLQSVRTVVNDGGKANAVSAVRTQDGYVIDQNGTPGFVSGILPPTNHWNIEWIASDRLFNTITGQINRVEIVGSNAPPKATDIRNYSIRGELNIDTSYDQAGNWMGMTFDHDDGSTIEFRCLNCNNTPDKPT